MGVTVNPWVCPGVVSIPLSNSLLSSFGPLAPHGRRPVSPNPVKETSPVSSWEPRSDFVRSAPVSTVGIAVRMLVSSVL